MEEKNETIGYNTLNNVLYKFSNALLIGNLVILIGFILYTGINYILFPQFFYLTITGIGAIFFSLFSFIIIFLTTATSLKRNDLIIIRKYRSGSGKISRMNLKGKSELYFEPRDKTSKVLISWAGAITDITSGCKIIQISEGHPTNDNLNSQVSESEWDKDVARLTKAKSVADLAEAELFNQGLLGLKWQDIVLIILVLLSILILGYMAIGVPSAVAKETVERLLGGALQQAIAGIVVPTPTP
jgi:hypothetical protein